MAHRVKTSSFAYQNLEARNLLAANLWVDFGSISGLTFNDETSANLNGPEVFGGDYDAGRLVDFFTSDLNHDLDGDGIANAQDSRLLVEKTMQRLDEIFIAFDITIQQSSANDLADLTSILQSADSNDAYVIVGNNNPVSLNDDFDFGHSVVDTNNQEDNLAFVWADDINDYGFIDPVGRLNYFANFFARAIAKQASHTFGLSATEASIQFNANDVVAEPGTRIDGQFNPDTRYLAGASFFTNHEMELRKENGVSFGTQNSFQTLADNIGLDENAPAYFTGTGEADLVGIIQRPDNGEISISIGNQSFDNVDVSNGLYIVTGNLSDLGLQQASEIYVRYFEPFDATFVTDILTFENGERHVVVSDFNEGNVDESLKFTNTPLLSLAGDGRDRVRISGFIAGLGTGRGNDQVILETPDSNLGGLNLGPGDDKLISESIHPFHVDAHLGYDIMSFTNLIEQPKLIFQCLESDKTFRGTIYDADGESVGGFNGFEVYNAPERNLGLVETNFEVGERVNYFIEGSKAVLIAPVGNGRVTLNNFADFKSSETNPDRAFVKATDYDVNFDDFRLVRLGTNSGPTSTTENIQDNVAVQRESFSTLGINNKIVVNDRGSAGTNFLFNENVLKLSDTALAGSLVLTGDSGISNLNIFGSETSDDRFVSNFHAHADNVRFFGNGGDDTFALRIPSFVGDDGLNNPTRYFFDGGEGDDFLNIDDTFSSVRGNYELKPSQITKTDGGSFNRINFNSSTVETAHLKSSNTHADYFRVTPDPNTKFRIDGFNAGPLGDRVKLTLLSDSVSYPNSETKVANYSDRAPVVMVNTEFLTQQRFLLTEGGDPSGLKTIQVRDAETFEPVRTITTNSAKPSLAAGDLNGDGIDEIAVANWNSEPLVRVFDGRSGDVISTFRVFVSKNSVEDFLDIAIGNVVGDESLEIVVTKGHGLAVLPIMRVFEWNADASNFELNRQFNAGFLTGGTTVALADMNRDGYQDIIASSTSPNILPSVVVWDVSSNDDSLNGLFDFNLPFSEFGYRGGMSVAVGGLTGTQDLDLIFTADEPGHPDMDDFRGPVYLISEANLPAQPNAPLQSFDDELDFFGTFAKSDLIGKDLDGDGTNEVLFISSEGTEFGVNHKIRKVDYAFEQFRIIETFEEDNPAVQGHGITIG